LFATDETPADDPVVMPYHLSSHILLWFTFRKLAAVMDMGELSQVAERTHNAIWREFVTEHHGHKLFAYLTDGAGSHHLYHDANDLPLALAPLWGFCTADNPIWRATMHFAFSPANTGGYYPGHYGSLGSVHTPDSWALGDVQAYIVAKLTGDREAEQQCMERRQRVAQFDGALPEAYSALSGEIVSRHWFSWPGAAWFLYVDPLPTKSP
jgi:meiotically up-regulated gene 157 (Mug157) protein